LLARTPPVRVESPVAPSVLLICVAPPTVSVPDKLVLFVTDSPPAPAMATPPLNRAPFCTVVVAFIVSLSPEVSPRNESPVEPNVVRVVEAENTAGPETARLVVVAEVEVERIVVRLVMVEVELLARRPPARVERPEA